MMKEELFKCLSEEQIAKVRNCKTHEEMLKIIDLNEVVHAGRLFI